MSKLWYTVNRKNVAVKDGVEAVVKEMNDKFSEPFSDVASKALKKALLTMINIE